MPKEKKVSIKNKNVVNVKVNVNTAKKSPQKPRKASKVVVIHQSPQMPIREVIREKEYLPQYNSPFMQPLHTHFQEVTKPTVTSAPHGKVIEVPQATAAPQILPPEENEPVHPPEEIDHEVPDELIQTASKKRITKKMLSTKEHQVDIQELIKRQKNREAAARYREKQKLQTFLGTRSRTKNITNVLGGDSGGGDSE